MHPWLEKLRDVYKNIEPEDALKIILLSTAFALVFLILCGAIVLLRATLGFVFS